MLLMLRAVTLCLRRLQETPIQVQKEASVVQLADITLPGSRSMTWALMAKRAKRSVMLLCFTADDEVSMPFPSSDGQYSPQLHGRYLRPLDETYCIRYETD